MVGSFYSSVRVSLNTRLIITIFTGNVISRSCGLVQTKRIYFESYERAFSSDYYIWTSWIFICFLFCRLCFSYSITCFFDVLKKLKTDEKFKRQTIRVGTPVRKTNTVDDTRRTWRRRQTRRRAADCRRRGPTRAGGPSYYSSGNLSIICVSPPPPRRSLCSSASGMIYRPPSPPRTGPVDGFIFYFYVRFFPPPPLYHVSLEKTRSCRFIIFLSVCQKSRRK